MGCTFCDSGNGTDLQNDLAFECTECVIKDVDLDHILVHESDTANFEALSLERTFTDIFDVNGEQLPLSDHWGVSLEIAFIEKIATTKDESSDDGDAAFELRLGNAVIVGLFCTLMMAKK